jgi:hypothetical protein
VVVQQFTDLILELGYYIHNQREVDMELVVVIIKVVQILVHQEMVLVVKEVLVDFQ